MDVLKAIETTKTSKGDKPVLDCVIRDSGVIEVSEPFEAPDSTNSDKKIL